jgi:hypothetical protein
MEVNEFTVMEFADRAHGFAHKWSAAAAEVHVEKEIAETRAQFTRNGVDLTSEHGIEKLIEQTRTKWDSDAARDGVSIETGIAGLGAILADRIEAAKQLPATIDPPVSRQERQLEELTSLLMEDRFRARFREQTRRQAREAYAAADDRTQAGRRLVVFLETQWPTIQFRDDPDSDAIAIAQMRAAIEVRQLARVPKQLLDWRDRLQRAERSLGFSETMRHLRSGRGIARLPKPMTLYRAV